MSGIVRIDFNLREEQAKFKGVALEQFPFAVALALTRTAIQAQKILQRETAEKFHLHGMFIPKNIKVVPAQKKDIVKFGLAEAFVGTTKATAFMTMQETGGTKTPRGKALSLPSAGLGESARTASGKIRDSLKPKALLSAKDAKGAPKKKGKGGKPQAFVAKGMILIRQGKGRFPLRVLYTFEQKADIKPRWEFERTIKMVVTNYFAHNLEAAMRHAVATAKEKE